MKIYLLVMLLSSGEIVRSEVPLEYCAFYVQNLQSGQVAKVDEDFVVSALCAPKAEIEKAFEKVGTQ